MKYMGSKNRIAKYILPIILKDREPDQWYVEPFVGGANMIDKVSGNRIGADAHKHLVSMWNALVYDNWIPQKYYTKEEHKHIRDNKDNYKSYIVGWLGFNCSYSGVYFGGYAGKTMTKSGLIRDYQQEAINNVTKQIPNLKNVIFKNINYDKLDIPPDSIIYCDPPYKNTSKYKTDDFDHGKFWQWCRDKSNDGHQVFISEYSAPDDFDCIWSKEVNSSLSANGISGKNKKSIEKLFIHISQKNAILNKVDMDDIFG